MTKTVILLAALILPWMCVPAPASAASSSSSQASADCKMLSKQAKLAQKEWAKIRRNVFKVGTGKAKKKERYPSNNLVDAENRMEAAEEEARANGCPVPERPELS